MTMYLDFFGFEKVPFQITPNPEFMFSGSSHKEALASIVHGVMNRKGFVVITGDVGVGKTTILRYFLDRYAKGELHAIYLFNANVSFTSLLKIICQHLGLPENSNDNDEMLRNLHRFLISEFRAGGNVALIIDEAQNMPVDTLENLRMLSNLETTNDKLIQIVFSAQPEFDQTLDRFELRQLKQRIAVRTTILPLSEKESAGYIRYRLTKALKQNSRIFTSGAVRLIVKHAMGIPRVINIICDNALVAAFDRKKKLVNKAIVSGIIHNFSEKEQQSVPYLRRPATVPTFVAAAAIAVALLTIMLGRGRPMQDRPTRIIFPIVREEAKPEGLQEIPASSAARTTKADIVTENQVSPSAPKAEGIATGVGTVGRNAAAAGKVREVTRVVKAGERLERLLTDVYGTSNGRLMKLVKERNPAIQNFDLIMEGEKIVFPLEEGH
jgi:general secretion pathway protein A